MEPESCECHPIPSKAPLSLYFYTSTPDTNRSEPRRGDARLGEELVDMLADDLLDLLAVVLDIDDALLALKEPDKLAREDVALEIERGLVRERLGDGSVELRDKGV